MPVHAVLQVVEERLLGGAGAGVGLEGILNDVPEFPALVSGVLPELGKDPCVDFDGNGFAFLAGHPDSLVCTASVSLFVVDSDGVAAGVAAPSLLASVSAMQEWAVPATGSFA